MLWTLPGHSLNHRKIYWECKMKLYALKLREVFFIFIFYRQGLLYCVIGDYLFFIIAKWVTVFFLFFYKQVIILENRLRECRLYTKTHEWWNVFCWSTYVNGAPTVNKGIYGTFPVIRSLVYYWVVKQRQHVHDFWVLLITFFCYFSLFHVHLFQSLLVTFGFILAIACAIYWVSSLNFLQD